MSNPTKGRKRKWSFKTGEKGINRVRLYPHSRDGTLYLEWYEATGEKRYRCLSHTDIARGKQEAEALSSDLRQGKGPLEEEVTLKSLFDNYKREVTPTKGVSARGHDERASRLFLECWGSAARAKDLDRRDWDRFIQQRRSGALRPKGGRGKDTAKQEKLKGVRNRVIEYDLKYLIAVCNWALTVRVDGEPMLERNPFAGFPMPVEANPRRPDVSDNELEKLTTAAKALGPDVELFLLLAHETGHRCTSVGRIRWSDVDVADPKAATIHWRPEHDKIGLDQETPISEAAATALARAQKRAARIGDGWVFPSPIQPQDPKEPEKPIRRDLLRDWWQKLEKASGIDRVPGRGWHSLRRKFATELKHEPMKDLCTLGGWKDHNTVLKCYMKADEATMRKALVSRAQRRAVGV